LQKYRIMKTFIFQNFIVRNLLKASDDKENGDGSVQLSKLNPSEINVIRKGRVIYEIHIKSNDLRFLRSNCYFKGSPFQLSNQFNIKNSLNTFFPNKCITKESLEYEGPPPPFDYFAEFADSSETLQQKQAFYATLPEKWNFAKESEAYAHNSLWLLTIST